MRHSRMWRRLAALVVLCGSGACAGVMRQLGMAPTPAFAPPRSWDSGVKFVFADPARFPDVRHTTRVEFANGGRRWTVTEREMFVTESSSHRTPWYPLRPQEQPAELYFTIEHPGGARTFAQFPLPAQRGSFYTVSAHVYTKRTIPGHPPSMLSAEAAFPLHPGAGGAPGDSLWIGLSFVSERCFNCPT